MASARNVSLPSLRRDLRLRRGHALHRDPVHRVHTRREPRLDLLERLPFREQIGDRCGKGLDFIRRKPVNPLFILVFKKAFIVFNVPV
jgi:hypothetical protein